MMFRPYEGPFLSVDEAGAEQTGGEGETAGVVQEDGELVGAILAGCGQNNNIGNSHGLWRLDGGR